MGEEKAKTKKVSEAKRTRLAKLSDEERRKIERLVKKAVNDRDLPKFKEGLARLGFDESSAEYEKLMQLWDAHWRASRHD